MSRRSTAGAAAVLAILWGAPALFAAGVQLPAFRLMPGTLGPHDQFGSALAVGDRSSCSCVPGCSGVVAVGAYLSSSPTAEPEAGAVYLFHHVGNDWPLAAVLRGAGGDWFGFDVAIDGTQLLVGAPRAGDGSGGRPGAAYLYDLNAPTTPGQPCVPKPQPMSLPAGRDGDEIGSAVALSGGCWAVGARGDSNQAGAGAGSVYVFCSAGPPPQKLYPATPAVGAKFGQSVSLDGCPPSPHPAGTPACILAVGAPFAGAGGAAYVFAGPTGWQRTPLPAAAVPAGAAFGYAVAASGSKVVIGAPLDDSQATMAGAAYLYLPSNGTWVPQPPGLAGSAAVGAQFGVAVAFDRLGQREILAGARLADSGAGAAYLFGSDGSPLGSPMLSPQQRQAGAEFGFEVAILDGTLAVGAFQQDGGAGAAYVFVPATPTITTMASKSVAVGGSIMDQATLSGGTNAGGGTITFNLFAPGDGSCASSVHSFSVKTVSGEVTYASDAFTTTTAGTYQWVATYSGDSNNASAAMKCGDEPVVVTKATTSLTSQASPSSTTVGGTISDQATLSGGSNPSGDTITFDLFAPSDRSCKSPIHSFSVKTVSGQVTYLSDAFTTTTAGTYHWVARYSGDINNAAAMTKCGDEPVVVTKATPSLASKASPSSTTVGGSIRDQATLSGGSNPGGSIAFKLFAPGDGSCASPAFPPSVKMVSGDRTYTSDAFTPTMAGTYHWVASYSGDANNSAASTACNDPRESVMVSKAIARITTTASPSVPAGGSISDTASLAGGASPTGSITFKLYGPNDATCTGTAAFTSTKTVTANGPYTSDPFATTLPGTYRWIASYSGDADNSAVTTSCNDSGESVTVSKASTTITTTASRSVPVGGSISDRASLAGGASPTGSITFRLFGPDDATCTGTVAFTSAKTVTANGPYTSDPFTTALPGTYRWIASYSGDVNNSAVATACNDAGESVKVGPIGFYTLPPCRALDTRLTGVPFTQINPQQIYQLSGVCGVPASAVAVAVNVTLDRATADLSVQGYPGDLAPPGTNTVSVTQRRGTVAGFAVLPLATSGDGTLGFLMTFAEPEDEGQTDLLLDVTGYFAP